MFINHEVEMYCCRQQIYCIVVNSVVGDASLCFAFVDFWWRRSLDVLQLCKEMCRRNCLVSEMIFILQWLGRVIHSLCKSQWFSMVTLFAVELTSSVWLKMHRYFFRFPLLLQVMQTWEILCWHCEDVFTRQTWCISVFPFSGRSDAPLKQDVVCGKNHVCSIVRVIRYRCFIVWNQSSACVSAQKRVGLTCMRELGVLIIPCCLQICQVYECTFRVLDWYVLQRSVKTWPAYLFKWMFAVHALWNCYV